jgi:hypothetical protein
MLWQEVASLWYGAVLCKPLRRSNHSKLASVRIMQRDNGGLNSTIVTTQHRQELVDTSPALV